ncbi:MAG: hypothetical protein HKN02_09920 [Rhodobacteraceae bacterium]|nr:hypothetical protein [Paracoccaceae bacterium]
MSTHDHQTLEYLEKDVWPDPDYDSHLVTTCHRLRKKRLGEFEVEDLRIMIGQGIGLKYLLPKAVEELRINPFVAGDFFEGDLLVQVLNRPLADLREDRAIYDALIEISRDALDTGETVLNKADRVVIERFVHGH